MNVYFRKSDIEKNLTYAFKNNYKRNVALTGILLARPEDTLVKNDILPHLEYWHHRSDYYTDFYCVGYAPLDMIKNSKEVAVVRDNPWGFDTKTFVDLVVDLEESIGWDYDGSPCLLLLNSYYDGKKATLDFNRGIWLNLRIAIKEGAVDTPTQAAEIVFAFAKKHNESSKDPIWEISDDLGRKVLKKGLKDALIAFAPKWAQGRVRESIHFAVHDLQKVA